MDIKQLAIFCEVAEAQSLSRAAIATDIAPSLVSRRVAQLEQEWGARLFDRTGRGMVLSAYGHRMYPEVKDLLRRFDALSTTAIESSGLVSGVVHVGVPPSMSQHLLPELFADIHARAPSVRLRITEGFSGALIQQLGTGRLDIAIVSRYGASAWREDDIMGWLDTCLIGRPLPNHHGQTIAFKDLEGIPLVLPPMPNGLRSALDLLARQKQVVLNIAIEVETLPSMKDVALRGSAWTMLPLLAVREEVASGALVAWPIERPSIKRTIAIEFSKRHPLSNASRLVAARIRTLAPAHLKSVPRRKVAP
ncbi:transcriptional regulator, LysR family [Delftia sp. Cs1-4]|uniref:LysR family transcriptional regulator n=1 Tax=Delftia sp. (strain Cs1-4) TaxID=742013 RepID=UPI00020E7AE5|nr:LysR family transcriptional regulator [Delftia sp. Cs1-4]AEF88755.1 transcriptional regulator, LysR family [Delftia sp. Cs1-4]